jgi:hypothetical protein
MHAFPMEYRVVSMLYGLLCDGKLVARCDIANRNGAILQKNLRLLPEEWRSSLSEAEFLGACGRRRVFRLTNTRNGPHFVVNVRIITRELEELLSQIAQASAPPVAGAKLPVSSHESDPTPPLEIYQTGAAGRPSKSWHLIEPEFRRRWEAGERHTGRIVGECKTEWADVLIAWLKSEHPKAPPPARKTLSNKLRPVLTALIKESTAQNPDIGRPN